MPIITKCFSSLVLHMCCCLYVWSYISLRHGTAGNDRFFLWGHLKEQDVCHSSRRSASYSQQTGNYRLNACESLWIFLTLLTSHILLFNVQILFLMFFRTLPASPKCDQQGSDGFRSNLPLSPPPLFPLVILLTIGRHCLLPLSVGENCTTLTWRLVAMEIQGAVVVATGFLWYFLMR